MSKERIARCYGCGHTATYHGRNQRDIEGMRNMMGTDCQGYWMCLSCVEKATALIQEACLLLPAHAYLDSFRVPEKKDGPLCEECSQCPEEQRGRWAKWNQWHCTIIDRRVYKKKAACKWLDPWKEEATHD